jgi:hypothetical protein
LAQALRAAFAPTEIDPRAHELLLEQALEDPFAPADEEERAESQRLRDALETGGAHPDAELARALGQAAHPEPALSSEQHARIERRALQPARSNVIFVAFGAVAAVAALAASIALVVSPVRESRPLAAAATQRSAGEELAVSRSTAPLFHAPFETSGTTARVDRIASARARELRENRYAQWGLSR